MMLVRCEKIWLENGGEWVVLGVVVLREITFFVGKELGFSAFSVNLLLDFAI